MTTVEDGNLLVTTRRDAPVFLIDFIPFMDCSLAVVQIDTMVAGSCRSRVHHSTAFENEQRQK